MKSVRPPPVYEMISQKIFFSQLRASLNDFKAKVLPQVATVTLVLMLDILTLRSKISKQQWKEPCFTLRTVEGRSLRPVSQLAQKGNNLSFTQSTIKHHHRHHHHHHHHDNHCDIMITMITKPINVSKWESIGGE